MAEKAFAKQTLRERLEYIQKRIALRAEQAHRPLDDIELIAITKTHPSSTVAAAIANGIRNIGENRVQEAESKITEIGRQAARWHLVGHLQANKARKAVKLFDVIHSLDSTSLAHRLNRLCEEEDRDHLSVLIQVDLAGEQTKSGITPEELEEQAAVVNKCDRLDLSGLMILPPFFENVELVRPYFRKACELRDRLKDKGYFGETKGELSMGMTHDFEIAIEEGATLVRIGTALFGERE
jgi:PLP dependent protein